MTLTEQLITIAAIALGTMVTRFLPFVLFPSGQKTPGFVQYLGQVLPGAVFGLLVVYSLKNVSIFSKSHALPEILAVVLIFVLHKWKHSMLLSIAGGTIFYILLLEFVF